MTENLVNWFTTNLSGHLSKDAIVFIISMIPILELRGGMLAASLLKISMVKGIVLCVIGNIIPVPFILLFINKIFDWMRNTRFVKLVNKLEEKGAKKTAKITQYKTLGLFIFVAIPPLICLSALFSSSTFLTSIANALFICINLSLTSLCTVDLETPNFFAAPLTVSPVSIIYCANPLARSSIDTPFI